MNKRGYMKTVEAILALVLVLTVVVTIANRNQVSLSTKPEEIEIMQETINNLVEIDSDLRTDILQEDYPAINNTLRPYFDNIGTLKYSFIICNTDYCPSLTNLPDDRSIYVSNLVVAANRDIYSNKVFKLYIWRKVE